jgi:predicted nuclease of predicted toxin-antitoxin system
MGLKFFVDHCVPTSIVQSLRKANHEVLLLKDYLPKESLDQVVISKAQELNAILVSLNRDFADIVKYPPANYKGIIAIQLKNRPEIISSLTKRLNDYLSFHPHMEHYKGKLFIIEVHRIRVHT